MNEKDLEINRLVSALDETLLYIKSMNAMALENFFSVWAKELELLNSYKKVLCPDCKGEGTFTIGHNGVHAVAVNANCGTCGGEKYIWEKKWIRKK